MSRLLELFKKNNHVHEFTEKFFSDPYDNEVTMEQLDKFLAVHGTRGTKVLSIAGKVKDFNIAITTDIGRHLLNDVMVQMEMLLEKIIESNATKEDLAEYRVLRKIINRWSKKIVLFQEAKKNIRKEA